MALVSFSSVSPNPTEVFSPLPVEAGKTKTILQVRPHSDKFIGGWSVSLSGAATDPAVAIELVEVDAPATVTAMTADAVSRLDEWAAKADLDHLFAFDDDGTGTNATDEGSPTEVKIIDALLLPANDNYVRHYVRGAVRVSGNSCVRVRVKSPKDVGVVASVTVEC